MLYPITTNSNKMITVEYGIAECFNDEEINRIKNSLNSNGWQDAKIYQTDEEQSHNIDKEQSYNPGKMDKSHRKHKSQLLPPTPDGFPLPKLTYVISNINSSYWNFDIRYINLMIDPPSIFKYDLGGKFNWHFDLSPNQSNRKLAYSIQLSDSNDYEGGDLEFFNGDNTGKKDPNLRKKGNIISFPSYAWHRITPITKGTRYAMVGWIHGPTFR